MARRRKAQTEAELDRQLEDMGRKEAGHAENALVATNRSKSVIDDDELTATYVPPPPDEALADSGAALEYSRARMEALTPLAVREMEAQMRFGESGARMRAAEAILNRAGFAAHDGAVRQGGTAPVQVNINLGGSEVPEWLKSVTVKKS